MLKKYYFYILSFSLFLAITVVVLGAYTRLSDAGLGCPDWPGCYGSLTVPEAVDDNQYQRPLETGKAWKEMLHRYAAGTLGLCILLIVFITLKYKKQLKQSLGLPFALLTTVTFQALLGMWTVTQLLTPTIVTAHLVGGFLTLSLLWWLWLNQKNASSHQHTLTRLSPEKLKKLSQYSVIALILLIIQILLGGWTSTNYAALACGTSFPDCADGLWTFANLDFINGFNLTWEAGVNYEFGIKDSAARMTIHFTHRIGALIVFIYFIALVIHIIRNRIKALTMLTHPLLFLLVIQIVLGISNVVFVLPMSVAVAHNMVALLLLLIVIALNHRLIKSR